MNVVTGFFRFWYDFIIGDDWVVALLVVLALIALLALKHGPWALLPIVVIVALGITLWRASHST